MLRPYCVINMENQHQTREWLLWELRKGTTFVILMKVRKVVTNVSSINEFSLAKSKDRYDKKQDN